ncbi:SusC/RagA family TonB-linked outer membrane protein [Pinibacter aurantiacus]|uniref:TonB-dependent receptor n=1 Tax=Pinibacter aurantiacus TaxID=2851599 RepID=A0A9E2W859_9BACT|nr:TonB-dependent receptor [Pinibacter aurantiacus]MBV4357617.1 TonB-dependent receptor [Pinibacter aurantiacus]
MKPLLTIAREHLCNTNPLLRKGAILLAACVPLVSLASPSIELRRHLNAVVTNLDSNHPLGIITGKVTDDKGEALANVSVMVKGQKKGVSTNLQGLYSINAENNSVLVFSFIGYDAQEVVVGGRATINVSLATNKKELEQVVVVGYGQVRKKDLTGAVVSIKGDEVKKVAGNNVMESVQGKMPGVDIVRTSGAAGAGVNITVRGNRSIQAQNNPLFIVDGIQYSSYQDINPNDIQSMEVLKDASSTAIFGAKGANGVIIISTKRGTSGKPRISAGAYYGQSKVAGYPKPMTGPEFADLKRQAYRTAGIWKSPADDSLVFTSASELAAVRNGVSTYWPGYLIHNGSQQDYNIGVAGGSERTKVYFSVDYLRETGILSNDYNNRYAVRLNIEQMLAKTFKVGLESQLTYYKGNSRQDGVLTVANKVLPYYTPYNDDGTLAKYPGNGAQFNPLMEEVPGAYINETNTTRILSTAYAEWKPLQGLTIRSNLGITNNNSRNGFFESANTIDRALSSGSLSRVSNALGTDLIWENIITYQKKINKHNFELTGVTSYIANKLDSSRAEGTGQLLPSQSYYALQNNPANLLVSSSYVGSNLISGAFRLNYSYAGKYLLTATVRADGSSILSEGNKWAYFPSVAAGWRIIDEDFMKAQHIFSELKLRASYGVAGNYAVAPYATQSLLALIPYQYNDKSTLAYGFSPRAGNPNLKWELTNTLNIGLDYGFFKNRLLGTFDFYDSRTHDLLLNRTLPTTSGYSLITQNVGKTRNTGFEIGLTSVNIENKNFSWSSTLTFTHNKERIVDLVDGQSDIANSLIIGYPVKSFWDYEKIGIWQTSEAADAAKYGSNPGDIKVRDLSGPKGEPDGKIDFNYDKKVVGSAVPKYTFGFGNDLKYKGFDFNIFIVARVGQTFVSDYANKFEPNAIENGAVVDYWTPENATNDYPRPNSKISRAALPYATTLGYKDGSFLKIRSMTLGYTLPATVSNKMHVSSLRFYVSAKNYFTMSKVKDYDPEGSGSFERPLTKLILGGLNIDL